MLQLQKPENTCHIIEPCYFVSPQHSRKLALKMLRQPYVVPHTAPMQNMSYLLTASGKFLDTLDKIVVGLNKAGFSAHDYKVADSATLDPKPTGPTCD